MTKFAVNGANTISRFKKLAAMGPMVRCQYSGEYFPKSETNLNKKTGRRIAKQYDTMIHDELEQNSKITHGANWVRGGNANA